MAEDAPNDQYNGPVAVKTGYSDKRAVMDTMRAINMTVIFNSRSGRKELDNSAVRTIGDFIYAVSKKDKERDVLKYMDA